MLNCQMNWPHFKEMCILISTRNLRWPICRRNTEENDQLYMNISTSKNTGVDYEDQARRKDKA